MYLKGKSIFVVEDNLSNRIVFQMALERHGATVDFERHGRDTLKRLEIIAHIDAIILDLMLTGGLSGFDLCAAIRQMPRFDSVPVVAVSAMDASVAVPKARNAGFNGFISKPIDSRTFPQQISKLISGEEVWYAGGVKMS